MTTGLIDIMKRAARDENENSQPTDLRTGTVVSTSPLKVQITNVFTVPESMLIVPKHLTDYTVEITIDGVDKKIKVHNALEVGNKIALIRKKGGQSFYILDRI